MTAASSLARSSFSRLIKSSFVKSPSSGDGEIPQWLGTVRACSECAAPASFTRQAPHPMGIIADTGDMTVSPLKVTVSGGDDVPPRHQRARAQ